MKTQTISLKEKKAPSESQTKVSSKNLEVILVKVEAKSLLLSNEIGTINQTVLLEVNNQSLTTLLDFTGVTPYEIWYFDENFLFQGKSYSMHQGTGAFLIQTTAKWILLVPIQAKDFAYLQNFVCAKLEVGKTLPHHKTKQKEWEAELDALSNEELIETFNQETIKPGWVGARGIYQFSLIHAMLKRGWKVSNLVNFRSNGSVESIKLSRTIYLENKMVQFHEKQELP